MAAIPIKVTMNHFMDWPNDEYGRFWPDWVDCCAVKREKPAGVPSELAGGVLIAGTSWG
jgi:hypothetical protein